MLTLGRNANRTNILASDELLAARGVTLHEINRGGDVTYHGPGQLVGYPIFDLRSLRSPERRPTRPGRLRAPDGRGAHPALRRVRRGGRPHLRVDRRLVPPAVGPGLWTRALAKKASDAPAGERKIAAIGIHVARGVTSHGFAFNVTTDLRDFTSYQSLRHY